MIGVERSRSGKKMDGKKMNSCTTSFCHFLFEARVPATRLAANVDLQTKSTVPLSGKVKKIPDGVKNLHKVLTEYTASK